MRADRITGGQVGPMTLVGDGLTMREHQRRTVENLVQSYTSRRAPCCVDMHDAAGVDADAAVTAWRREMLHRSVAEVAIP